MAPAVAHHTFPNQDAHAASHRAVRVCLPELRAHALGAVDSTAPRARQKRREKESRPRPGVPAGKCPG
jgi:hypothetical protein